MKRILPFILILCLCSRCLLVYVPNTRNVPLFSKRGQLEGNASIGLWGRDIQGAASVTNHVALIANYSYRNKIDSLGGIGDFKYKFFEGGIGYFWRYHKYRCEVFAGYGKGNGESYNHPHDNPGYPTDLKIRGKYTRFFFQPSIGYRVSRVDFAFTWRVSFLDFTTVKRWDQPEPINPRSLVIMEPAMTVKYNFASNRIFTFVQASTNVASPARNVVHMLGRTLEPPFSSLSVGLGFRLGSKVTFTK